MARTSTGTSTSWLADDPDVRRAIKVASNARKTITTRYPELSNPLRGVTDYIAPWRVVDYPGRVRCYGQLLGIAPEAGRALANKPFLVPKHVKRLIEIMTVKLETGHQILEMLQAELIESEARQDRAYPNRHAAKRLSPFD